MASIGDVFISLMLDDVRFQREVVKAGAKGGDAAGQAMGAKLGMRLRNAVATGLGAAVGGVLGTASALGGELNAAVASFSAEVGATAADTAKAQETIAGLYRTNIISFQQASDTLAALRTDLGLTQEEADAAAESFVAFANVTKQEPVEAVRALDDILDAWNMDASKAPGIMDQLVASHQKYGGSIAENEQALKTLAPQLQALGVDIDGAIGLLNLFETAGLDSAKATFALNTAVKKLEPGQTLPDLVAQVTAIEDPTLRAQKAIELFGARGGVALANVLRPGIGGLDDFSFSAEEVAGKVTEADKTLKSAFGTRVQLAIRNVGGALAQAAQNFGPFILGFAQLGGPRLVTKVGATIGGIFANLGTRVAAGLAKSFASTAIGQAISGLGGRIAAGLSAQLTGDVVGKALAGGLEGSATTAAVRGAGMSLGKAFQKAFILAAVVGLGIELGNLLRPAVESAIADFTGVAEAGDALLAQTKAFTETATDPMLQQAIRGLQDQLDSLPVNAFDVKNKIVAALNLLIAESNRRAGGVGPAVGDGIDAGAGAATDAAGDLADGAIDELDGASTGAESAGKSMSQAFADGVVERQDSVTSAIEKLRTAVETQLTYTAEVARVVGFLTSQELADALKDSRPGVREQAEATRDELLAKLEELGPTAKTWGKEAGDSLAEGLKSKDPYVRQTAEDTKRIVDGSLSGTSAAKDAGSDVGQAYADGLRAKYGAVKAAAYLLYNTQTKVLRGQRPAPDPNDPNAPGRQYGGPVMAGTPYIVGESGPELFVPSVPGTIIPSAEMPPPMHGAPEAGNTYIVNVAGLMAARSPAELVRQLRRVGDFGVLTPRSRFVTSE